MYVHFEKKLGFLAHMRTASTATAEVFMKRGFTRLFGHHSLPLSFVKTDNAYGEENERRWFTEDPFDYRWACTIRNPFDLILSWQYIKRTRFQGYRVTPLPATPEWLDQFFWHYRSVLWSNQYLFSAVWEIPGVTTMRYEILRQDLDAVLHMWKLEPLAADEFLHTRKTPGRPTDSYRNHITPEMRAHIETRFTKELERFGYSW